MTNLTCPEHEPHHAASPTASLLSELQLYGHRPFQDEPDPRPLPDEGAVRTALGVSGALSLVIGLLILVWPGRTAEIAVGIISVYVIIAGLVNIGIGLFWRSGWARRPGSAPGHSWGSPAASRRTSWRCAGAAGPGWPSSPPPRPCSTSA